MARKRKIQEMRVIEIQSYLKGIVDFGGDDWHPTKEQWETILGLIMNIKEEEPIQMIREVVNAGSQQYRQPETQQVVVTESKIDGVTLDEDGKPVYEPINNGSRQLDLRKVQERKGAAKIAEGGQVASSGVTIVTRNKEADDTESDFA